MERKRNCEWWRVAGGGWRVVGGWWLVVGGGETVLCEENSMAVLHYRQLEVWQIAIDLVEKCYQMTSTFPREEIYGLTSQIRRAAVSVPSNLAEGQARGTTKEFLRFISISRGSLAELETQLYIAHRIKLIDEPYLKTILALTDRIGRMLAGLRSALRRKLTPPSG